MCPGKESCLCKASSIPSDREAEEGARSGRVSNVRLRRVPWGAIKVTFPDVRLGSGTESDPIHPVSSGEGGHKMSQNWMSIVSDGHGRSARGTEETSVPPERWGRTQVPSES